MTQPPPQDADRASTEPRPAPMLSQLGLAFAGAGLASLACTGHAAIRLTRVGVASWPVAWLALAATAFLPALVLLVALPRASAILGAFDEATARTRWTAVFMWLAFMEVSGFVAGKVLRQSTHHHALAGATFGVAALGLALFGGLLAGRLAGLAARLGETAIRVSLIGSSLVVVGLLAFLARALSDTARATLIDAAAFVAAVALASRASRAGDPRIGWGLAPVALALFLVGAWLLRAPGDVVVSAIDALVPLYARTAALLGR